MIFFICLFVFFVSVSLTLISIKYAVSNSIMDVPNFRSSHTIPTPRGGGISFVITFLTSILVILFFKQIEFGFGLAFFIGCLIVAIVGYVDDLGHVDSKLRLFFHFTAALILVQSVSGLHIVELYNVMVDFDILGYVIAVLIIVWMLNLFNFMDGIDGLAGAESLSVLFITAFFLENYYPDSNLLIFHLILGFSILGFMVFNFPPAKIFMGDAGSGFLGFVLAGLMLKEAHIVADMFWIWLTMLGVFIVDATYTLVVRIVERQKIFDAHRTHAYQKAAIKYKSHRKVTLAVVFINLVWLAPVSCLIFYKMIPGIVGVLVAYIPLVFLVVYFRAGRSE